MSCDVSDRASVNNDEMKREVKETMSSSRENNRLLWWIMGLVGIGLTGLVGSWANAMYTSVEELREGQNRASTAATKALEGVAQELRTSQIHHLERIVKLEAYSQSQRDELSGMRQQVNERLIRIESKVDELRK